MEENYCPMLVNWARWDFFCLPHTLWQIVHNTYIQVYKNRAPLWKWRNSHNVYANLFVWFKYYIDYQAQDSFRSQPKLQNKQLMELKF